MSKKYSRTSGIALQELTTLLIKEHATGISVSDLAKKHNLTYSKVYRLVNTKNTPTVVGFDSTNKQIIEDLVKDLFAVNEKYIGYISFTREELESTLLNLYRNTDLRLIKSPLLGDIFTPKNRIVSSPEELMTIKVTDYVITEEKYAKLFMKVKNNTKYQRVDFKNTKVPGRKMYTTDLVGNPAKNVSVLKLEIALTAVYNDSMNMLNSIISEHTPDHPSYKVLNEIKVQWMNEYKEYKGILNFGNKTNKVIINADTEEKQDLDNWFKAFPQYEDIKGDFDINKKFQLIRGKNKLYQMVDCQFIENLDGIKHVEDFVMSTFATVSSLVWHGAEYIEFPTEVQDSFGRYLLPICKVIHAMKAPCSLGVLGDNNWAVINNYLIIENDI